MQLIQKEVFIKTLACILGGLLLQSSYTTKASGSLLRPLERRPPPFCRKIPTLRSSDVHVCPSFWMFLFVLFVFVLFERAGSKNRVQRGGEDSGVRPWKFIFVRKRRNIDVKNLCEMSFLKSRSSIISLFLFSMHHLFYAAQVNYASGTPFLVVQITQ